MFMPFVRLLAIYIIVGLAIFAFFQRDAIVTLIAGPAEEPQIIRVSDLIAAQKAAEPVAPEITQPVAEMQAETAPVYAPAEMIQEVEAVEMEAGLESARAAFWEGDKDKAEAIYKNLVATFPEDASLAGELGNLYYNSGRHDEAAMQYYTVGMLSLEAGNTAQTAAMIGILQSIAPEFAADLRARTGQ